MRAEACWLVAELLGVPHEAAVGTAVLLGVLLTGLLSWRRLVRRRLRWAGGPLAIAHGVSPGAEREPA